MAERKKTAQEQPVEETIPQEPETGEISAEKEPETGEISAEKEPDPWKETVSMIVPKKAKGDEQQYYICVNDVRYLVPANGKMQELPVPVAEALKNSLEMEDAADEYAASIPNMTGEIK
jgi:hypothetical protein